MGSLLCTTLHTLVPSVAKINEKIQKAKKIKTKGSSVDEGIPTAICGAAKQAQDVTTPPLFSRENTARQTQ